MILYRHLSEGDNVDTELIGKLFEKCFFQEDEIINGRPLSNYVTVESFIHKNGNIVFSSKHLNELKSDILTLLDSLPDLSEGVFLEDLKKCKWNKNNSLDKFLLMASSIKAIKVSSIETDKGIVTLIKRDKENDDVKIIGLSKENIPEVKQNIKTGYTDEEKEIIRQNGERITDELHRYLEIINKGFSFFGYSIKLDEKVRNKVNVFDLDNNLVFERTYLDTDGIIGAEGLNDVRLLLNFKLIDGSKFEYWLDKNVHHFSLTGDDHHHFGYGIDIHTNYGIITGMSLWSVNPEDEYTIKKLEVFDDSFNLELENAFGPYGNYVDGTTRHLMYHSPNNRSLFFCMQEKVWPDDGKIIYGDEKGFYSFDRIVTSPFNGVDNFHKLATNIISHPRNRAAINYILNEFDKVLPNVSRYFKVNIPFLRYLLNVPYVEDEGTNNIVNYAIDHKCDFKVDLKERKMETPKD